MAVTSPYSFYGGGSSGPDTTKVDKYTTQDKTASFTATAGFIYLIDSAAGAVVATLPAANVAGQSLVVKWSAGSNTVTVQRAGSDTIGAATTSAVMGLASEVWEFISSGSGQWNLTGGNKTLTSLDGRFAGLAGATFTGEIVAPDVKVTGTTGAPNQGRFVGVTTSGAPTSGTYLLGDFCLTQNGQLFVCVAPGTPGTWTTPSDARDLLAAGEETKPRVGGTSAANISLSTGTLRLTFFTARKTETVTQMRMYGGTAAAATPSLVRFGVYTVAANGDLTLVASTPNDTTLFSVASTANTKTFSVALAKTAGQRYAAAALVVTATTAPQVVGCVIGNSSGNSATAPRLSGALFSQTDLPSSISAGSVLIDASTPYAELLP